MVDYGIKWQNGIQRKIENNQHVKSELLEGIEFLKITSKKGNDTEKKYLDKLKEAFENEQHYQEAIKEIGAELILEGVWNIPESTSKAALKGLTQAMAIDFGQYVRVNIIQPAAISTEMLVDGFKNNQEGLKQLEDFHPSGFIGTPEDVAQHAIFISTDESRCLNVESIEIDCASGVRLYDPD